MRIRNGLGRMGGGDGGGRVEKGGGGGDSLEERGLRREAGGGGGGGGRMSKRGWSVNGGRGSEEVGGMYEVVWGRWYEGGRWGEGGAWVKIKYKIASMERVEHNTTIGHDVINKDDI